MKIKVQNYKIIKDLEIDVDGITLLLGKNGNGKSALVQAIRAACFGQDGDFFIRNGEKNCSSSLAFNDASFQWFKSGSDAKFIVDGKTFEKTRGKAPDEYINALKIRKLDISKSELRPNFSMQFDPLFLIYLSPLELANSLSFLFSGEKFPSLLKTISGVVRDSKKNVVYMEGEIAQKEKNIESLKQSLVIFDKVKKWFPFNKDIFNTYQEIKEIDGVLYSVSFREKELVEKTAFVEKLSKINFSLGCLRPEILQEVSDIDKDLSMLSSITSAVNMKQSVYDSTSKMLFETKDALKKVIEEMVLCPICGEGLTDEDRKNLQEGSHA